MASRLFGSPSSRLFLISFVMLFLEVALIRWISTEIRIFAYVNNLVLLACFLGIGIGCYTSTKRKDLALTLLVLLILLVAVKGKWMIRFHGEQLHLIRDTPTMLSVLSDSIIWDQSERFDVVLESLLGITSTLAIFSLLVVMFVPLGRMLGNSLREHGSLIAAYSLNIAASLLGIWTFNVLSFAYAPPWVWFAAALTGLALLMPRNIRTFVVVAALFPALLLIVDHPNPPYYTVVWSPYQKLELRPTGREGVITGFSLRVNSVSYMGLLDFSERFMVNHPELFPDPRQSRFSQYNVPYLFKPRPAEVLIVGAGGGNDAAGALRNGAEHVTAVEIDPGIYRLGSQFHPEAPYQNPKVSMVIDDARSFFKKSRTHYDLISFGLLDAHTLSSTYNNARIDHYVYTVQSFLEAKALLKPDGVMTVIFHARRPWLEERLRGLLTQAFGHEPLVFDVRSQGVYGYGGTMFVSSPQADTISHRFAEDEELHEFIAQHNVPRTKPVQLTTDDWPYLYLERSRIPMLHLCLSAILLTIFLCTQRLMLPRGKSLDWHLFFLGAAFLLLEFQNISKATLLFGSTWFVSAIMISMILSLALLANLVAAVWKRVDVRWVYAALFGSITLLLMVPLSALNLLPFLWRGVIASLLLNLPIFFGGLIFIRSFAAAKDVDLAFGSNLLGAGAGGLLESLSFMTGITVLLVLVGLLYLVSWFVRPRSAI